ncbi:MAG: hypothetical protein R3236_11095, partial [Phycisphaeraceae bacterium]|nr:hypothetical protein [Phycisphaeraceae bacterium]
MSDPAQDPDLMEGYRREDRALRLRMSKIAHGIALVAVLGGTSLDAFVYPQWQGPFLRWRLMADGIMAVALALHWTRWGRRNIRVLSMFWVFFMNAFLSVLIYLADGAASPYYAGINLVLLGV